MTGEPSDPCDPGINSSWRSLNLWTDTQMKATNRSQRLRGKLWLLNCPLTVTGSHREADRTWPKTNNNTDIKTDCSPLHRPPPLSSSSVRLMRGRLLWSSAWVTLIIGGIFGFYSAAMGCTRSSLRLTGRHKKWEGGKVGLQSVIHIIPLQRLRCRRPRAKHFDVDNDVGLCCHLM